MLLKKIKEKKKLFLSLTLGGLALATVASFMVSEKFEAKVTVRSATVGSMGQQSQQSQQSQVESNTQTVARLASPRFYTASVIAACGKEGDTASETLSKSIKATIVKLTTDMTQLSYVGIGRDETARCLESVVKRLTDTQEDMAQSRKKLLTDQLALRKTELSEVEKLESTLNTALNQRALALKSPAEIALYLSNLLTRKNQTDEVKRTINEIASALEAPSTQKMTPLEPIYVSPKPVSPNHLLFSIFGLFIGLLACAALCWREIWQLINADNDATIQSN